MSATHYAKATGEEGGGGVSTQSGETSVNAARVGGGSEGRREMKTGECEWKTVSSGLKSGLLSFIHLKCKSQKEADTEHGRPSPPPSSPAHLHGKDCRVPVKAEACRLRRAVWAPLSQFILPRVGEHVRAARTGEANGAYCCNPPPIVLAGFCSRAKNTSV